MSICQLSFNIAAWNVVPNIQLSPEDWKKGEFFWRENKANFTENTPKLAFLPPLKRRRLSPAARLFFESVWELVGDKADIPVVYASQNGEINRSFELWEQLFKEGDISPTSFSLSVHNAIVGQWSEMRQVKSETTALTAKKDNLETALLEAFVMLEEGVESVLVVITENPLSEVKYPVRSYEKPAFAYSLGLIIEKGMDYQLNLHSHHELDLPTDNALAFVQNQYLETEQWQTRATGGGYWQWSRKI